MRRSLIALIVYRTLVVCCLLSIAYSLWVIRRSLVSEADLAALKADHRSNVISRMPFVKVYGTVGVDIDQPIRVAADEPLPVQVQR